MNKIIPISDLQSKVKKYVELVRDADEPIVITQRGRAAAMLVNYATYEGLLATVEEMSFSDWKRRLRRAEMDSKAGRTVSLEAYKKRRARRR